AAAPAENVRRERPEPGDVVILLGGATGRDGIGGATGSSKSHNAHSVEECGAEVQKGNAPEERKLQRLFRSKEACNLIKRCNDFGAGGVSVAIGELADGLDIDLNAVPKKYEGLDGTELAISESQERMAVVVAESDVSAFLALAGKENLRACPVATVTETPRLVMRWNGEKIVNISREFLNSNGAEKHIDITPEKPEIFESRIDGGFTDNYKKIAADLNICSKRGLSERFDSTIGANTVLMPFGGKYQLTPLQAMVQKISVEKGHTNDCSVMSWAYDPFITEKSPYHGAYTAVVESVCKLIAAGADIKDTYLTFQEYFEKPGTSGKRWGKPLSALLGAFEAQKDLGIAAIGGKDSMSGSFEQLAVPPTLVSFAVTTDKVQNIISPEFKAAGHKVYLLAPKYDENGLPDKDSVLALFDKVTALIRSGKIISCYVTGIGGIGEAVMKMSVGNMIGFEYTSDLNVFDIFKRRGAAFAVEATEDIDGVLIGITTDRKEIKYKNEIIDLKELTGIYEDRLESVYACNIKNADTPLVKFEYK
ncbi:MAG: phosphoribosylformylglycinamidine synthase, partial [Clostridia bacterium]|nr:phosphoribosylformylglycinamidine synthase [Clostridia bacterium]